MTRWGLAAALALGLWACGVRAPVPTPTPDPEPLRILLAASVEDSAILCVAPTWRMRIDYAVTNAPCLSIGALREYVSVRRQAEKD